MSEFSSNNKENGKFDRIQNLKPEHVTLYSTETSKVPSISEISSEKDTYKIHTGESFCKSFIFEQSVYEEETEKCVSFWKTVVEKNLQPIKCSMIQKQNRKHKKESKVDYEELEKCKEMINESVRKLHAEYENLWKGVLNDMKRKKLDELKLIGTAKCSFCGSLATPSMDYTCKMGKEELTKLNEWKPPPVPPKIEKSNVGEGRASQNKTVTGKKKTDVKYEFRNVIEEKKKNNLYQRWRSVVKCQCGLEKCTCGYPPVARMEAAVSEKESEKKLEEKSDFEHKIEENELNEEQTLKTEEYHDYLKPSDNGSDIALAGIDEKETSPRASQQEEEQKRMPEEKDDLLTFDEDIVHPLHTISKQLEGREIIESDDTLNLSFDSHKRKYKRGTSILKTHSSNENYSSDLEFDLALFPHQIKDSVSITKVKNEKGDKPFNKMRRRDSLEIAKRRLSGDETEEVGRHSFREKNRRDSLKVTKARWSYLVTPSTDEQEAHRRDTLEAMLTSAELERERNSLELSNNEIDEMHHKNESELLDHLDRRNKRVSIVLPETFSESNFNENI